MKPNVIFLSICFSFVMSSNLFGKENIFPGKCELETMQRNRTIFPDSFLLKKKMLKGVSDTSATPWLHFPSAKGVPIDKILVTGNVRFITIYRSMSQYYPDLMSAQKNFSFTDYPIVNAGAGNNNGSVPMVELTMTAPVSNNLSFMVGYSYAHSFAGYSSVTPYNGNLSSRSNLWFGGNLKSDNFALNIDAGQILWTRVSRFTMGQPIYRDNYFDRLPWDWYRRSFERYIDYYNYTGNLGPEGFGRSPVQGVVMNAELKNAKLGIMGVFGRTNRNLIQANATNHFPSLTYVLRVQKGIISKAFVGKVGLNLYDRDADTDPVNHIKDQIQLGSFDLELKRSGFRLLSEIGVGRITNPLSNGKTGLALDVKADVYDNVLPLPISLEYYNISVNAVSLDGSILNSNTSVRDGGFANQMIWDNMLFINIAQEVGQLANNRQGLVLTTRKTIGNFKAELGYAISQEIQNLHDTVTIQHRVNAFSRSRFRPWFQASGPYGRIKNGYYRSFETITITDQANGISSNYRKGFNSLELLLKYKTYLFGRDLIFLNFINYNSIQANFSLLPTAGSSTFVHMLYEDLIVAYAIGKSYSIVGEAGIEKVKGSKRTNLSSENGGVIDQTGYGLALGIDYDFHKQANLHLRHRWLYNKDKNFTLDRFQGTETYVELKIFF